MMAENTAAYPEACMGTVVRETHMPPCMQDYSQTGIADGVIKSYDDGDDGSVVTMDAVALL